MTDLDLSSFTNRIVDLNNQAATDMDVGECTSAISKLAASSRLVKSLAMRLSGEASLDVKAPVEPAGSRLGNLCYSREVNVQANQDDIASDQPFFVFRRPLLLRSPESHLGDQCSLKDAIRFSQLSTFANVYNLALCHHVLGITTCSRQSREAYLQKAARLYEYARNLLSLKPSGSSPQGFLNSSTSSIHAVVVLNNLLHVEHELSDTASVQRHLPLLSTAVMWVLIQSPQGDDTEKATQENLLEGFSDVIWEIAKTLLVLIPTSAAPAA